MPLCCRLACMAVLQHCSMATHGCHSACQQAVLRLLVQDVVVPWPVQHCHLRHSRDGVLRLEEVRVAQHLAVRLDGPIGVVEVHHQHGHLHSRRHQPTSVTQTRSIYLDQSTSISLSLSVDPSHSISLQFSQSTATPAMHRACAPAVKGLPREGQRGSACGGEAGQGCPMLQQRPASTLQAAGHAAYRSELPGQVTHAPIGFIGRLTKEQLDTWLPRAGGGTAPDRVLQGAMRCSLLSCSTMHWPELVQFQPRTTPPVAALAPSRRRCCTRCE